MCVVQPGSIQQAQWPAAGPVDAILLRQAEYLTDAAHDFRVKLKNYLTPGKAALRHVGDSGRRVTLSGLGE